MHHGTSSSFDGQIPETDGEKIGATGRFPGGKLTPEDDGELKFAITAAKGKVVVEFGTPVKWFGMNGEQARELAKVLEHRAREADIQASAHQIRKGLKEDE